MARNAEEQREIERVVGQLNEAVYAGKVMSIAYLMIDNDGQVNISFHVTEGQAMTMMGLTKVFDVNLANHAIKSVKPKDFLNE